MATGLCTVMVTVTQAVLERRSIRAFLDRPVGRALVAEILALAARAPSGGNLQPWRVDALAGAPLATLKTRARAAFAAAPLGEGMELKVYPAPLGEPYRARRHASGEALYASIGIAREDRRARLEQFARNFDAFGAPVLLIFSIDRIFDRPQWAHLGMFMQNIMLLAAERGLATCPQEAWATVHRIVADAVALPECHIVYCGIALGFADEAAPINALVTDREPVEGFARFQGFEE
jgi:nitroreductase